MWTKIALAVIELINELLLDKHAELNQPPVDK